MKQKKTPEQEQEKIYKKLLEFVEQFKKLPIEQAKIQSQYELAKEISGLIQCYELGLCIFTKHVVGAIPVVEWTKKTSDLLNNFRNN